MMAYSRRAFLGRMALLKAGFIGSASINFLSCSKEEDLLQEEEQTEALVIGSGFGGAVAALRLSEAGIPTILAEQGKFWDDSKGNVFSPNLPPDNRSTWLRTKTVLPFGPQLSFQKKHVGVLDMVEFKNMNIYQGNALGGGSIANGGVLLQPEKEVFNTRLFPNIDYSELDSIWFPKVRQMLFASLMPRDLFESSFYKFSQISEKHAIKSGFKTGYAHSFYDFNVWRKELNKEIKKSALKGELIYGCNNGIKNSLDKNYIAEGIGTGNLKIHTLHKARMIEEEKTQQLYKVVFEVIDEQGNIIRERVITAKYLFICAGNVGSNKLLLKARDTGALSNLNNEIGKGWGHNGNAFCLRSTLKEYTGDIHSSPPTMTITDENNPITPTTAMQDIFPVGIETRSLLLVGVPLTDARASFTYNIEMDKLNLDWGYNDGDEAAAAIRSMANRLNDDNGGKISTFIKGGVSKDFTYHPLGGIVLGKASDLYGRLKGYSNLYCLDSCMLPGSAGMVNPALTIAALAERNMNTIIREDIRL